MESKDITAKTILTAQKGGFLQTKPYPFTHTLSPYTGCGYGRTTCGLYCYAQYLPQWLYSGEEGEWGDSVLAKVNAAELLEKELGKKKDRSSLRVFMSSTTDPYQPLERKYEITRKCLEVFSRYDDLDLLVVQTTPSLYVRRSLWRVVVIEWGKTVCGRYVCRW